MTTLSRLNGGPVIVWPQNDDTDQYEYEHAIAFIPYSGSIAIEQCGNVINIPLYAMRHVIRALRQAEATAKEKS